MDQSKEVQETTGFLRKENPTLGIHYDKHKHKTRVLVFMLDKDEYAAEMQMLRYAGRLLSQRMSIRIGLVEDPKLIRLYKARHGAKWFNDDVQLSTIIVQRFDKQIFPLDLFHIPHFNVLQHFISKKSLMPVTEIDQESSYLIELLGQQVIIGVYHLNSKNEKVRDESRRLLERTLPEVAPAVYKGMQVATTDYSKAKNVLDQMNLTEDDLPILYATDTINQLPYKYNGPLEYNPIVAWAQELIKTSTPVNAGSPEQKEQLASNHVPGQIKDQEIIDYYKKQGVTLLQSKKEFNDQMDFVGDDIVVFMFSTGFKDNLNQ